ncbi:Hypothetical predicted protein [Paramuricea clavata]|uniref:Uncharacterized protein n=1 Tax=Paramuricea clavata TaxID=317549 RepID=A0A6S7HKP5_PARCT|nr:Hypothetical predicted protein [Paramuricea clavata]
MAADREALSRTISVAVSTAVTDTLTATLSPNLDDNVRLPSAFDRLQNSHTPVQPRKRRMQSCIKQKVVNKNIICILQTDDPSKAIPIPRGESRARLADAGLTGIIAINSIWQEAEVRCEISNLFASAFGLSDGGEVLPFVYLRYLN